MSHHIEQKAERVACELNHGQVREAANELRNEMNHNPREALALIQMANQMRDQRSPDHIVVQGNGNVFVRDEYHRTQVYAGHLEMNNVYGRQEHCDPRHQNNGYDDGRYNDPRYNDGRYNDPRYNDGRYSDPRYNDGRYNEPRYSDGRYSDPRYNDGRYNDPRYNQPCETNNTPYYGNPYPNERDCPPVYRQPEVYQQQPIYVPDCYGNERRGINPGTAALLLLGGAVIGRAIGGHGRGNFSIRERW